MTAVLVLAGTFAFFWFIVCQFGDWEGRNAGLRSFTLACVLFFIFFAWMAIFHNH